MGKLLIIYYHEVVENGQGFSYQKIDKDKFENQMKYLYENGYHTLLFSDLDKPLPEKAIIVSFDDGFRTVYENAAPIMLKYRIKGNVYLPTKYVSTDNHFMTWEMIKDLSKNGFFEIQAHTHSHVDIRGLDKRTMEEEINLSDALLKKNLGYTPKAFCIPYGTFDKNSINLLMKTGRYKYILGSNYGRVEPKHIVNSVLPRIGISNDDDIKIFEYKILGKYDWKGPLQRLRLIYKNIKKERISQYKY